MTSQTGLDNLDFKTYRALLEALLPAGSLCALSDAAGQYPSRRRDVSTPIVAKVLGRLDERAARRICVVCREIVRVRIPPSSWLAAPLRGADQQTLGYLLGLRAGGGGFEGS